MANKTRALTLDAINNVFRQGDAERGFLIRVQYRDRMFARKYMVNIFNGVELYNSLSFRHLSDAIDVANEMDELCKKSRNIGYKEATTR